MTRILGVLGLLVVLYAALAESNPAATSTRSLTSLANIQGRYGVVTLGAALVIITGGIDLSVGSVVGCATILFGVLMTDYGVPPPAAAALVLLFGATVGLVNGLLVTKLKLQPFLVTLCGMFIFRGAARMIGSVVGAQSVTEVHPEFAPALDAMTYYLVGKDEKGALVFPAMFALLLVLAAVVGFFLHRTAYGRYWYAIGYNEQAARYAGVNVDRHRAAVYVICSTLAALGGILLFLDINTHQADTAGAGLELYAILGAVLGGCSLRGGEGTAVGMVLGAMVLPVIEKLVNFRGEKSTVIPVVIGTTLLIGTIVDELIRRRSRLNR
ncbi:MAG: ABC transporter permease [Gemmataceae bacterium]|nr:ABC transporter permease [Gemmataceae bacterium]